ncbi:TetR/AcrR family transcriptional regulator [bacterium SCSIO 12643]|nr:TetR/AcrR family transcriptional regulator [bacterium SCSIO 12643]
MSPRTREQNLEIRAKTKKNIILSSMRLFGQNGYEGTSVNAIAKEANISKGLVYYHFESKEHIVRGIVEFLTEIGDNIIYPKIEFETPKHHLKYIIDEYFNIAKEEAELMSWMLPMAFQVGRYPFVAQLVTKKTKMAISAVRKIFQELNYPYPEQEAWAFGALFDGISMDQILVPNYDSKGMHQYLLNKYELNNI